MEIVRIEKKYQDLKINDLVNVYFHHLCVNYFSDENVSVDSDYIVKLIYPTVFKSEIVTIDGDEGIVLLTLDDDELQYSGIFITHEYDDDDEESVLCIEHVFYNSRIPCEDMKNSLCNECRSMSELEKQRSGCLLDENQDVLDIYNIDLTKPSEIF